MEHEPTSRVDPLGWVGILLLVVMGIIIGGAVLSARQASGASEAEPALAVLPTEVAGAGALAPANVSVSEPASANTEAAGMDAPPVVVQPAEPTSEAIAPPASPTPPPTAIVPTVDTAPEVTTAPTVVETATVTPEPAASPAFAEAPLPTPPGVYSWTLKVPILMYHYLSTPPEDADIYRVDLSVSPESFREQLSFLKENGYSTVDLYDLSRAITNQAELPEKPIILTFDDGYIDNYEYAFPLLREFDYKATFFIVTDFVDKGRAGYMDWPMIEEMAAAGMRMESHSRNHPDLRTLSRDGLIWEMLGSRETLAAHIGYTPRYFAYPGGDYNEETIQTLDELAYWGAVTTTGGTWHGFDDRFEWSRVRIRFSTTLSEFASLVDLQDTSRGKFVD